MEDFPDAHPKAALAASAALWSGMAILWARKAREAWSEGRRMESVMAGAGAVASGAVVGLALAQEAELIDRPLIRFE